VIITVKCTLHNWRCHDHKIYGTLVRIILSNVADIVDEKTALS
jgi:hypothetical protein